MRILHVIKVKKKVGFGLDLVTSHNQRFFFLPLKSNNQIVVAIQCSNKRTQYLIKKKLQTNSSSEKYAHCYNTEKTYAQNEHINSNLNTNT